MHACHCDKKAHRCMCRIKFNDLLNILSYVDKKKTCGVYTFHIHRGRAEFCLDSPGWKINTLPACYWSNSSHAQLSWRLFICGKFKKASLVSLIKLFCCFQEKENVVQLWVLALIYCYTGIRSLFNSQVPVKWPYYPPPTTLDLWLAEGHRLHRCAYDSGHYDTDRIWSFPTADFKDLSGSFSSL